MKSLDEAPFFTKDIHDLQNTHTCRPQEQKKNILHFEQFEKKGKLLGAKTVTLGHYDLDTMTEYESYMKLIQSLLCTVLAFSDQSFFYTIV